MIVYTIATQKGGTGKTTTAAMLAQAAAVKGNNVLGLDLDPQGNLSFALAADARRAGSYDLLHGTPAADVIQHSPQGLDVIPASPDLQTEASTTGSARRLQKALRPIDKRYDMCFIDTPATAGELQYNALQAADRLIIVLEADTFSVQALYQITDTAQQIKKSNPHLTIAGVILARYESNTNINKYLRDQIKNAASSLNIPYLGEVRKAIAAKEALSFQRSIFEYEPKSYPAIEYMSIFEAMTN